MLSRVLGLVREQLFYWTLGAGGFTDAYVAAFRIPNLLRDLFAEGALSLAFVPTYVHTLRRESREAAFAVANRVLGTLGLYLGALAVLVMIVPQPVVLLVGGGFAPETASLCADLVRIMMPFLPLVSVAVAAMGVLNAEGKYTAPALASSMFNLVAIVGGAMLLLAPPSHRTAVVVWSVLTLAGGVAQLAIQVPALRRLGFRFRLTPDPALRDPATRRIAALMAPAALGVAAVQVNVIVNTWFASHVEGAVSWLNAAFRLMQLPIGVFGVAIGTAATTHLARDAAADDIAALGATLRRGLRLVLFLAVPSTVGLALLAEPIIALIYQHGRFGAGDTQRTAEALAAYTVGLSAYAAVKVVAPAFYALGRPRVPVLASASAVALNLVWNVLTFRRLGHVGLALGTSVAAIANLVVLLGAFQARWGGLGERAFLSAVLRILVAAVAMGGALVLLAPALAGGSRMVAALVPVATGAAVYFAAAAALRLDEAGAVLRRRR